MVDPLLALCARAESHPLQLVQLAVEAKGYTDWHSLARRAEVTGLAPLVYRHFQAAGIALPENTRRELLALTMRHRRANQIRCRTLSEILIAFRKEDIEVLVLKGAALANTVYHQPGLRPMRDSDLLVRKRDALRAQMKLVDLGFNAKLPQSLNEVTIHHLPEAQRLKDGLTESVEVHFRLLPYKDQMVHYEDVSPKAISFSVYNETALTLNHEDMLWHIYRHSFALPLIEQPIRLIWVADFVSLVERYVDEIDWEKLKGKYRQLWHVLPLFHYLTPWSEKVLNSLNFEIFPPPKGVGQTFQGWPYSSLALQWKKGTGRFLEDTFWPSEWWTRLYYGLDRRSLRWWWTRLIRHPLHIAGWMLQYLQKRIRS
jgi:hypothetical protein